MTSDMRSTRLLFYWSAIACERSGVPAIVRYKVAGVRYRVEDPRGYSCAILEAESEALDMPGYDAAGVMLVTPERRKCEERCGCILRTYSTRTLPYRSRTGAVGAAHALHATLTCNRGHGHIGCAA